MNPFRCQFGPVAWAWRDYSKIDGWRRITLRLWVRA